MDYESRAGFDMIEAPGPPPSFCHLNLKSEYSLMDGSMRITEMVTKIATLEHSHAALTDHGGLFGAYEFSSACKKKGIVPILGCTLYMEPSQTLRTHAKDPVFFLHGENSLPQSFHLILLAKNRPGYQQLMAGVSQAYEMGLQDDIPITSWDLLRPVLQRQDPPSAGSVTDRKGQRDRDMVAISSATMGEISYLLRLLQQIEHHQNLTSEDRKERQHKMRAVLKQVIADHHQLLGKEDVYLEITEHGLGFESYIFDQVHDLEQQYGLRSVATADAYYLDKEDYECHIMSLAMKNSLTETDLHRRRADVDFHLLDEQEFFRTFARFPRAMANTMTIAQQCQAYDLETSASFLPSFMNSAHTAASANTEKASNPQDENAYLQKLAAKGLEQYLQQRQGDHKHSTEDYKKRLQFELDTITTMGFSGYFLIVQDFINWAKSQGIPVGPGRGSGAGSLTAFCLGITDIDPMNWGLIFERFLNPERVSLPDFDVDFCQWRREEVIEYVVQKYGASHVAHIVSFGRLMAKAAVKNVARVLGVPFIRMNKLTALFPNDLNATLPQIFRDYPDIASTMDGDDVLARTKTLACKIEGMASHTSVHPAGIVISDRRITHYVPTFRTSRDHCVMSQFEMKALEKVGLVKFDFLGLKTLTVIDLAQKEIRRHQDPKFDISKISLADHKTYEFIATGQTVGVFQAESAGMRSLARKLQASHFEDIIALVALFRPGPLGSGMVDDFIERKHGRQDITYLHQRLKPILEETYGMIVYQEQVQKIAAELAGYSLAEADLLRRAMGKKIPAEMNRQKERFIAGTKKESLPESLAIKIFDLMSEFAKYGFNKSHSAAYGLLLYQTAYLKCHHPRAFMMAIMTCDMDQPRKIRRYIEECQAMGITITAPCINRSQEYFLPDQDHAIIYAFGAIKGFSKKAMAMIIKERSASGDFSSLRHLCQRLNLGDFGKKSLEIMIQTGALDLFGHQRSDLLKLVSKICDYSQRYHESKKMHCRSLFALATITQDPTETPPQTDDPHLPLWLKTLKVYTPPQKLYHLQELRQESKLLSTFVSSHPMVFYGQEREFFASSLSITDIRKKMAQRHSYHGESEITVVAYLSDVYQKRTQSGKTMFGLRLEDTQGGMECLMFPQTSKDRKESPVIPPYLSSFPAHRCIWASGYIRSQGSSVFVIQSITDIFTKIAEHAHYVEIMAPERQELAHTPDLSLFCTKLKDIALMNSKTPSPKKAQGSLPSELFSRPLQFFLCQYRDDVCLRWDLGIQTPVSEKTLACLSMLPEGMNYSYASQLQDHVKI